MTNMQLQLWVAPSELQEQPGGTTMHPAGAGSGEPQSAPISASAVQPVGDSVE